jgi:hypothetical protein
MLLVYEIRARGIFDVWSLVSLIENIELFHCAKKGMKRESQKFKIAKFFSVNSPKSGNLSSCIPSFE